MAISVGEARNLREWRQPLMDACVIPHNTRRIIIDIPEDNIVTVYYECGADERMFTIGLADMLKGADVIGVADMPEMSNAK